MGVFTMRREIPLSTAVIIIVVAAIVIFAVGWFLTSRRPSGEGQAPKEFMPKPPYAAPGKAQPQGKPF